MKETRFKDTEVGLIPEDWDVTLYSSVVDVRDGTHDSPTYQDLGYPLVTSKNLSNGKIDWSNVNFISPSDYEAINKRSKVDKGDILFAMIGTIGNPVLINFEPTFAIKNVALFKCFEGKISNQYVLYYLSYSPNLNKILEDAKGSNQKFVPLGYFRNMLFYCPNSLSEQYRIASALTSIDNFLSSLDKLIAKKKGIKKGTMQQLLTGKKRLNGFTDPWVEKSLNSVFEFKKGNGLSKEKLVSDGAYLCMLYGEIFTRFNYVTKGGFYRTNYSEGTPSKKDDILMPGSTTTNGFDLVKAVAIDTEGVRLGGDIIILRKRENDVNAYFWASLISEIEKQKIADKTQGITIIHLHAKNLIDIQYRVPSTFEEQSAIASVLTAMDSEIAALEAKRAKCESIKQGMMQQLLTGKIRLVETAAKTNTITANVHFRRSVLAAEIADRLCEEPTFGHVKMEKMLFLTERLCDINIGSHYHRDAAGPYDNNALRSIDSQLKKQKWFEVQQIEKGYKYVAMQNRGKHKTYFDKYYSNVLPMFDKIINTFKTQRTEQCEIVATLYSAWEDLIHKNQPFTDADIVNEVLNNWHESKKRISRERWHESIQWMRNNGFTPNNISR